MCRLFAYKTKKPEETTKILIKSLKDFSMLAKTGCVPCGVKPGHNDGWGLVLYKDGDICFSYKSLLSIKEDINLPQVLKIIEEIKPNIAVVHLRKKTAGRDIVRNIQPFFVEEISMAHNGTIFYGSDKKDNSVSDSRYFFNKIIKINEEDFSLSKKINNAQNFVELKYNYTAMNMIFSDGKSIFAVNNSNFNYKNFKDLCMDEYYRLYKFSDNNVVFVCSEKIKSLNIYNAEILKNKFIYKY